MAVTVWPKTAMIAAYATYIPGNFMVYACEYGGTPCSSNWPAYAYSPSSRSSGKSSNRMRTIAANAITIISTIATICGGRSRGLAKAAECTLSP